VFEGTAGTITLSAPTAHNLNFNSGTYALQSSTLTLNGTTPTITVNPNLSASISSIVAGTAGLTKSGAGTLTLSGANSFSSATTISNGTLTLDYSSQDNSKLANASALRLAGGTLNLVGGTHTEIVSGTTMTYGASRVTRTSGSATLQMGAFSFVNVAYGDFSQSVDFGAAGIANGSTANNSSGILGGWATIAGTDWAVTAASANNTPITALASYVNDTWASANNVNVTGNQSVSSASCETLRFNAAAPYTITLSGSCTVASLGNATSGGILVTPNVGNNLCRLTGGTLKSSFQAWLHFQQWNPANVLQVDSPLATYTCHYAKDGPGTLVLNGGTVPNGGSGFNSFIINSGAVLFNAGGYNFDATGTGQGMVVNNGGTLGGSGIITNTVIFNAGSTLQPSLSGGTNTLTLASATAPTFSANSTLKIRVPTSTNADQVYLSSATPTFNCANLNLVLDATGLLGGATNLTIVRTANSAGVNGTFASTNVIGTFLATVHYNADSITVDLAPPPQPTKLAIISVNSGNNPTANVGFNVVVQAQDNGGTPVNVLSNTAVTLVRNSGTGNLGGTLTGTILTGGNSLTIGPVTYDQAEGGVSLTATNLGGTLASGNSAPFTVNASVDHFVISGVAATQTAGVVITNFTITAQDSGNNPLTTFTGTVTFGGTAGATGTSPAFVAGVCTNASVIVTNAGGGLTLTLSDGAVPTPHTATVNLTTVNPGALNQFAIVPAAISVATAGAPLTLTSLTAKDAFGNVCGSGPNAFAGTVNFAGTAGVTGTSAAFVAGVLTNVSVTPTSAGSAKTITVNDGAGHAGSVSIATLNPAAAANLALTSGNNQSAFLNTNLPNLFVVTVTDAYGNSISGTTVNFTIATIPSGASGQSLSAAAPVTAANGQASSRLTIGNVSGLYTVTATAAGLSGSPVTFSATGVVNLGAAGNGTWSNPAGGNWATAGNWSGSAIANGQGKTADFSTLDITGDTTVHLDTPLTIGSLTFGDTAPASAAGWTLDNNGFAGNALTLSVFAGSPTFTVNALGAGKTVTVSAGLAGTQGFTKTGAGTLVLAGSNTFTGGVTINAGTLEVTNNSLSTAGLVTMSATGKLAIDGTTAVGGLSEIYDSTATIQPGPTMTANQTLVISNGVGADNNFNGAFTTGAGGAKITIVKTGAGSQTLRSTLAANQPASIVVSNGTLALYGGDGGAGGYGNGAPIFIAPGAQLDLNDWYVAGNARAITNSGALNVNAYALYINKLTLLNGGTVFSGNASVWNAGDSGPASIVVAGSVPNAASASTISCVINLNTNTGPATFNVADTTGDGNPDLLVTGVMADSPYHNGCPIIKTGAGTMAMQAANTFSDVVTISNGLINLGAAETAGTSGPLGDQLANATNTIVLAGGGLQYSAANQFDYSGRFSSAAGQTYIVDTAGQNVTWATALKSSGGSLTKNGAGTLTLNGANTFSGPTVINAGTLALSGAGSLVNSSTITIAGGATLDASALGGFNLSGGQVLANSAGATGNLKGSMNLSPGGVTITYTNGTPAFSIANGTMNLGSNMTFTVNNLGAPLPIGNYKLVAAGVGGLIAGALPSVYVPYGGLVNGAGAVLRISDNELYLFVYYMIPTTLGLSPTANPSPFGSNVSFTATVLTNGVAATDAGSVVLFNVDQVYVGSFPVVNGQAVYSTAGLSVGPHTITAGFFGDYIYLTSGNEFTQTVVRAATAVGVASSANPSGYRDAVNFTAQLPALATGTAVFSSVAGAFSTNAVGGGSAVSLAIATLPRGTNAITVAYGGDGNFVGSTNTFNQVVTNHPPVASGTILSRQGQTLWEISVSNLLANATDADGDALSLAALSASTNGIALDTNSHPGFVRYVNANLVNDQFTYTVSDGFGGSSSAAIALYANDQAPQILVPPAAVTTLMTSNVTFSVTAFGVPAISYAWYFNGTNHVGGNSNSLAIPYATITNQGLYSVTISNSAGVTSSVPVMLTVLAVPPTVSAGSAQSVKVGKAITLAGTASDYYGLPLSTTWSVVSGPGTATFSNSNSLTSTVSFSAVGNYVLRLTADNLLGGAASADVQITVVAPKRLFIFAGQSNMSSQGADFADLSPGDQQPVAGVKGFYTDPQVFDGWVDQWGTAIYGTNGTFWADWATYNTPGGTWQDYKAWRATWTSSNGSIKKDYPVGHASQSIYWQLGLNPGEPWGNAYQFANGSPVQYVGPDLKVAQTVQAALGGNTLIVKYASGGTSLQNNWCSMNWATTPYQGYMYYAMNKWVNAALTNDPAAEVAGFFWMQGEADAGGSAANNYSANLADLIRRVRNDFGPNVPIIIGKIHPGDPADRYNPQAGIDKVRAAQDNAANSIPFTATVETSDLTLRTQEYDNSGTLADVTPIHLDQASVNTLGVRMAQAWLTLNSATNTNVVLSLSSPAPATGVTLPINFTAAVVANWLTATDATGTVVFQINGVNFSTNPVSGGVAVSATTTTLPIGYSTITASYSGDGNYPARTVNYTQRIIGPGVDYYVDPVSGSDTNSGRSWALAFNTIGMAVTWSAPGDTIYLKSGATFSGDVFIGKGGIAGYPLTILGDDPANRPVLQQVSTSKNGVLILNASHVTLRNLIVTGLGASANTSTKKVGVGAMSDGGQYGGIIFSNIDVSGFYGGMVVYGWGSTNSGFHDVLWQNCNVYSNLNVGGEVWAEGFGAVSNVAVLNCQFNYNFGDPTLSKNTGSGCVFGAVWGGLMDHCVAHDNGGWGVAQAGPAGLWAWNSQGVIIQYCEAYRNQAQHQDGDGYDLDLGTSDSVIQYCYSWENYGAGYLLSTDGNMRTWSNNVIRFCISENDGTGGKLGSLQLYSPAGPATLHHGLVHNNTFYNSTGALIRSYDTAAMHDIKIVNNIFMATNSMVLMSNDVPTTSITPAQALFAGNNYWTSGGSFNLAGYNSLAAWRAGTGQEMLGGAPVGLNVDPLLVNPGGGGEIGFGNALTNLPAYRLQANSPMINAALSDWLLFEFDRGAVDFFGTPAPSAGSGDIGAAISTAPRNIAVTTLGITSSANPATVGTAVTITATVQTNSVTAANATGFVLFSVDGGTPLVVPVVGGSASFATSALGIGVHPVNAVYSGNAKYLESGVGLLQTNTVAVTVPPTVNSVVLTSGGGFQMAFTGPSGQTYQVLTSTNLINWSPVANGTFTGSPVTFTNATPNDAQRFYRLQSP
jgi:autotransporter-associated beta strand protein